MLCKEEFTALKLGVKNFHQNELLFFLLDYTGNKILVAHAQSVRQAIMMKIL